MRKRSAGFNLLELVISILIITLMMFSVFQLLTSGMRYQTQSREATRLVALSQKEMEHARFMAFEKLEWPEIPLHNQPFIACSPPDSDYRYCVNYYNFQVMRYPPESPAGADDPAKRRYVIAVNVIVEGPCDSGGAPRVGFRQLSLLSLIHAAGYEGAQPPASQDLPGTIHPPPPTPMIPIFLPPTPSP